MSTDLRNQIHLLLNKAVELRKNGHWVQAVEIYSQVINVAPNFAPGYVERGLLVHEMGNPEKAFLDFEKAINIDPQFGPAYYGRGWVKHTRGDFNGELQDAKRGLLLDKENAGMYYRRIGSAHQGLKQYKEAIEFFNDAINFYSGNDEGTIYNRGMCYLELKEYTLALSDFNRSLEMDPDWAWAFASRGRTYLNMGDCERAIADCDMAVKYQPSYVYSYVTRGLAYEKLGNKQKAKNDFETILKLTKSEGLRKFAHQHIQNQKSSWLGLNALFIRYPMIMTLLLGLFFLLTVKYGFDEIKADNNLSQGPEMLSLTAVDQRMKQGVIELNAEVSDGQIDCSSLHYSKRTYGFSYTTYTLIKSSDESIILWSFYKGILSCEELESKPITGIVTQLEDAAIQGMYKTNLIGIRRFPNAKIYRFCGNCTIEDRTDNIFTIFGFALFLLMGFVFSLSYQWGKWNDRKISKGVHNK